MKLLSKYILAEKSKPTVEVRGSAVKSPKIELKRVDLEELEYIYITDALVRNAINAAVELFDCDYEIHANSETIIKEVEDFLDFIDFPILRKEIAKNCFIYGDAWCERVYSKGKLIGVINLNPKRIHYLKDHTGKIKLDKYGNPEGYIQRVDPEMTLDPKIQSKLVHSGGTVGILLKPEQIARFYFDTIGEGWYGIGLIEPIYSVTLGKNEAEAGLAHVINKAGFPIFIAKTGDRDHEPTVDMIDKAAELIRDLNYKTELAVPYYYDITTIPIPRIERLKEHLSYFIEQQITGLGIPKPIATGSGESTNRSTLVTQVKIFLKINDARRRMFANQFNKQILAVLAKTRNWKETPKLVPPKSDLESLLQDISSDIKKTDTGIG